MIPYPLHEARGLFQELRKFDLNNDSSHLKEGMDQEEIPFWKTGPVVHGYLYRLKMIVFA